ncbi:ribonuclease H-like domain-containing protein, partial [Tanacetum coccineum]
LEYEHVSMNVTVLDEVVTPSAFRSDKRQAVSISDKKLVWKHLNNERQLPIGVKVFLLLMLLGDNGVDVVILVESIHTISERLYNTTYGFFLGKRVTYPVVANYVRNTWGKYGLVRSMFSSSTGLFSFQFSSMDGLDAMLENGPWFIRNNPLILRKWHPDENLLKEDVSTIPIWVKLHGVLVTTFSEDGLSTISTKLGTTLMLDSYIADMWMQSWDRSGYARAVIELRADVELKDNIVAAMPKITMEGYYTCNIHVEYEWKPFRCACCKVFGHVPEECLKNIGTDATKNLKNTSQTPKGIPVGQKIGFKPKQVYQPVSKTSTAKTCGKKMNNSESDKEGTINVSSGYTPIGEKIDKIERQIFEGKLRFVDDDGNPLVPTVMDSDSKVEVVFDETANLRISTSGKEGSDKGYGTNSWLEQWRDSYPDNDDYDPYDDDMYENHDMSEHLQFISCHSRVSYYPIHNFLLKSLLLIKSTTMAVEDNPPPPLPPTPTDKIIPFSIPNKQVVTTPSNAKALWDHLKNLFHDNKDVKAINLENELRSIKIEKMTVKEYCTKIQAMANRLKNLDYEVSEKNMVIFAVNGLDSHFVTIAEIICHRETFPTFEMIRNMFLLKESSFNDDSTSTTFESSSSSLTILMTSSSSNTKGQPMSQSNINGILGASPVLYASQPTLLPSAFSTMSLQDPTWNMDTGATSHLNSDARNLSTIFNKHLFPSIHVGDGNSIPVTNTDHSIIPSHHRLLHLHNVLVTPNIFKNLISVRQFTRDNNYTIEFGAFGFSVNDFLTRQILLRCDSSGDLYPVTKSSNLPVAFVSTSSSWRQRLGHLGDEVLRSLTYRYFISCNKEKSSHVCHACQLGKHVKLPFHSSDSIVTKCFDIIYSDLWTFSIVSSSGFKYYVLFLDYFSHYVWIYLPKHKSDMFGKFMHFRAYVKNQFKSEIKSFQCDHGGEFDNKQLHTLFSNNGIQFRFSCPKTSQQNGNAKRMICTINNVIRTLLFQAYLPPSFWVEALHMATYLLNLIPSTAINNKIPFTKLFQKEPNYSRLRIFGCLCYPHLHSHHKLAPRATPCIFLGFLADHHGYRCLDLETNKIILSRHVTFDETQFPHKSMTPSSPPSYEFS